MKNQELGDMARRSDEKTTNPRMTLESQHEEQRHKSAHDKTSATMEIENLNQKFQQAVFHMEEKDHDLRNAAANVVEVGNQLKTLEREHMELKRSQTYDNGRLCAELS